MLPADNKKAGLSHGGVLVLSLARPAPFVLFKGWAKPLLLRALKPGYGALLPPECS